MRRDSQSAPESAPRARVIKQPDPSRLAAAPLEQRRFADWKHRIPGAHVRHEGAPAEPPAEPTRNVVIPKERARIGTIVFPLAEREFVADFPLPASASEVDSEPEEIEEPAPPTLEEVEAAWQARLEAAVEEARREGFEAGQAAAAEVMQQEVDELRTAFTDDLCRMEQAVGTFFEETEPQLAALAFRIAETILQAPLPESLREASARAIAEAIERASGEASADVSLHPVDYLRLQEAGVVDQLRAMNRGLRWHPNPDMKQGDWIVDSPTCATRRIESELLAALREQLGVSHDAAE